MGEGQHESALLAITNALSTLDKAAVKREAREFLSKLYHFNSDLMDQAEEQAKIGAFKKHAQINMHIINLLEKISGMKVGPVKLPGRSIVDFYCANEVSAAATIQTSTISVGHDGGSSYKLSSSASLSGNSSQASSNASPTPFPLGSTHKVPSKPSSVFHFGNASRASSSLPPKLITRGFPQMLGTPPGTKKTSSIPLFHVGPLKAFIEENSWPSIDNAVREVANAPLDNHSSPRSHPSSPHKIPEHKVTALEETEPSDFSAVPATLSHRHQSVISKYQDLTKGANMTIKNTEEALQFLNQLDKLLTESQYEIVITRIKEQLEQSHKDIIVNITKRGFKSRFSEAFTEEVKPISLHIMLCALLVFSAHEHDETAEVLLESQGSQTEIYYQSFYGNLLQSSCQDYYYYLHGHVAKWARDYEKSQNLFKMHAELESDVAKRDEKILLVYLIGVYHCIEKANYEQAILQLSAARYFLTAKRAFPYDYNGEHMILDIDFWWYACGVAYHHLGNKKVPQLSNVLLNPASVWNARLQDQLAQTSQSAPTNTTMIEEFTEYLFFLAKMQGWWEVKKMWEEERNELLDMFASLEQLKLPTGNPTLSKAKATLQNIDSKFSCV